MIEILLIEDFEPDQIFFKSLLMKSKIQQTRVDCVESLASAKKALEQKKYDLIVSDLGLSDCHGVDSLAEIKEYFAKTPTIILTGFDDDSLLEKASQIGVFDYLVKNDLTSGMLRRSIRYAINRFDVEKNRERLEVQLRKSQRLESLGKLTGGIAHDFNNKLAILSGNIQVLKKISDANGPSKKCLESMEKTILKSAGLTRQLLAFGQKQELVKENVDIVSIVSESLRLFDRITPKNIELTTSYADGPLFAEVDPIHIDQVLMNLFINAQFAIGLDHGEIDVGVRKIDLDARKFPPLFDGEPGPYICLSVKDTGVGMNQATKEKVFEPFFTTKENSDGAGLGLSVVDGIIRQLGGFIEIESTEGQGTSICIFLKISKNSVRTEFQRKTRIPESSKEGCCVLYIEDDEDLSEITSFLLKDLGFTVLNAANGVDAMRVFNEKKEEIDVVLTDMIMPKMNGKEFMIWARKIIPEMGFIFVSGYSDNQISTDDHLPENTHFHSKPTSTESLVQSLVKLSSVRRTLRKISA